MIDITFLVKPSEINAKGQCIIYCRFKCDGTPKKEISTGIQVSPDEFDTNSKRIITKGKKSDSDSLKEKNNTLNVLETRLRQIYNNQIDKGKTPTAQTIKEEFEAKKERRTLAQAIELLKKRVKDNKALLSKVGVIEKVTELFIKDKYKVDNIYLNELDNYTNFGDDFESYVKLGGNKRQISWSRSYLQKMFPYIKRSVELAVKQKWVESNPLASHQIILTKQDKQKEKVFLTKQELKKIIDEPFETDSIQRIADIFVFQCYTGLAYGDVKKLTYKDIRKNDDGVYYLHDPRKKTAVEFTIPLIEQAIELIEKYKKDTHREIFHADKVFPVKSNKTYNLHLKTIAEIIGLEKVLKTHVARYTCNQLLYEAGVSDEVRKQILGHTTVKMTAHYTTASTKLMNEAMSKIDI
jgi:integrase